MFKKFLKNTAGNMALIFAVSLMVLMLGAGAAVDYTSITSKKNSFQDLADAAVLAAARSGETDKVILEKIAVDYVNGINQTGDPLTTILKLSAEGYIQVKVTGTFNPILMGMFGSKKSNVEALAEAPLPTSEPVNVVFVLDTTHSMSGAKMASLKAAANDLLSQLGKLDSKSVKVSIIPFADYVNVGLSRRNEAWLNVAGDSVTALPDSCYFPVTGTTNCRWVDTPFVPAKPAIPSGTCYNDGVPYACGGSSAKPPIPAGRREVCDNVYSTTQVCTPRASSSTWHGCVGSRPSPWNGRVDFNNNEIPGLMNEWCGTEILPLTNNIVAAKTKISSLNATGFTYLPAGLVWGWRAITPSAPLTESNDKFVNNRRSVMILMTDGANTLSQFGQIHVDDKNANYDSVLANKYSKDLCKSINDSNIEVFSIAYEMSDITAKNILRGCASKPNMFFDARDSAQLKNAFEKIGVSLIKIRISH